MFWIIIGVLAGSYGPVDRAEAMSWRSNGIKKVLLLIKKRERASKFLKFKIFGFKYRIEVLEEECCLSTGKLLDLSKWIHNNIDNFQPTIVICEDDPTLTTTVLAAYLVYRGFTLPSVLMLFLKKKKYIIMPTKQQVELLRMFEIRVAKKNHIQ